MTRDEALSLSYAIPGWMWPVELGWLYDTLQTSRLHIEVGCYCGRSLVATAAGMGQGRIIAVDPLIPFSASAEWTASVLEATIAEIHAKVETRVDWWRCTSLEAMHRAHREGLVADSVFIDASHYYAETLADIEWRQFVKPGGIIAGHDYWPAHVGVMDAVNESFPFGFSTCGRVWWATL